MADLAKWDDWLTQVDGRVREGLRGVSLVSEAGIPSTTSTLALSLHVRGRDHLHAARRHRFTHKHRLSLIAAIVAVSRDRYRRGGLWPYVDEALIARGHPQGLDALTQREFREIFIDGLRELGLPTVGDGYGLVDTAAMHAGIPTYCLLDWFALTDRARRRVGEDAEEMTVWANANKDRTVMADIDKPIKRMLATGPEFAADLFERAAELLDYLAPSFTKSELRTLADVDPVAFQDSGHPALVQAERIGLDSRWVIQGSHYLSETHRSTPHRDAPKRQIQARPSVRLDFGEGALELTLPAIVDARDPIEWEVLIGDRRQRVIAELDTSGAFVSSAEVAIPLTQPIRVLPVVAAGISVELPLWVDGEPAVLFTMSGTHRPVSQGVVAPGSYWVLLPADATISSQGRGIEMARDDCPLGWGGWELAQVDLEPGQVITIARPDVSFTIRVQGGQAPELIAPPAVAGTRSFGFPVLGQRPRVRIPQGGGTWRITVVRRGEPDPHWSQTVTMPGEYEVLAGLFAQAGTYEVAVRGPLGHGMKETFSLVDGLRVDSSPEHRGLDPQGQLTAASARASASPGIQLTPNRWELDPQTSAQLVKVVDEEGNRYSIVHKPSATMVGTYDELGALRWRSRPAKIDSAMLNQSPDLLVRVPRATAPILAATSGRQLVQRLTGTRQLGGWRFRLGELAGAFDEQGPLHLTLADGQPVAFVAPIPSYSGVELCEDGRALRLVDWTGLASDMEVWVWLEQALWRAPVQLALREDGIAALPEQCQQSGTLMLHLRTVDPWVPLDAPRLPVPVTWLAGSGQARLTEDEAAIVSVGAGSGEVLPARCAPTLVDIWLVGPAALRRMGSGALTRLRIAAGGIGPELVREMAARGLGRGETAGLLVNSGLAMSAVELPLDDAADLWTSAPWLAGAIGCGLIPTAHTADPSDDEARSEQLRRAAYREFGASLLTIVDTGTDPLEAVGRFDRAAEGFEAMPADQAQALVHELGIVPRALLDRDSRAGRVLALSRTRDSAELKAIPNTRHKVLEAVSALRYSDLADLAAGISKLEPNSQDAKHHWLPAFARSAAIAFRAAARGDARAAAVAELSIEGLSQLSLIDGDLILAELARADALLAVRGTQSPTRSDTAPQRGGPEEDR